MVEPLVVDQDSVGSTPTGHPSIDKGDIMDVGSKVEWAGVNDARCAPGAWGIVKSISNKDPNSICVTWPKGIHYGYQTSERYTWERRKNLKPGWTPTA